MPLQTSQLALQTAAIAAGMEKALVVAPLVSWRAPKNLSSDPLHKWEYVERVKARFNVRFTTDGYADLSGGKQSRDFGAEFFKLNRAATLDYDYSDYAHIRDEDTALRQITNSEVSRNAGERLDAEILKTLVGAGCNWVGTPGTEVNSVEALKRGIVRAYKEGVPRSMMTAILAPEDEPALSKYLSETTTANERSQENALNSNVFAPKLSIAGINVVFTQQLPVLTTGTRTNGTVAGAGQNVNYKDVSRQLTANGLFLTQELDIAGVGNGATINDGEVFTLANSGTPIRAWDQSKNASQGVTRQFRVVGDHVADSAGNVTIRIFPAIVVANAAVIGDAGVNNAHATVDIAPANGATVTFLGTASTEYLQRAIVTKDVVRVETASPENGKSGENSRVRMRSIPLTLRGYSYTTGDTMQTAVRFDANFTPNLEAWGRFKTIRINGS